MLWFSISVVGDAIDHSGATICKRKRALNRSTEMRAFTGASEHNGHEPAREKSQVKGQVTCKRAIAGQPTERGHGGLVSNLKDQGKDTSRVR